MRGKMNPDDEFRKVVDEQKLAEANLENAKVMLEKSIVQILTVILFSIFISIRFIETFIEIRRFGEKQNSRNFEFVE
jgi:uncharacterized membrane protein YqhA